MRLRQAQLDNLNNDFPCRIQSILSSTEIYVRQFNEPNVPIETSQRNMIYVPNWLNIQVQANSLFSLQEVRNLIDRTFEGFLLTWSE